MLEGLDQVDWSSLQHAYGAADDVPELIRAIAEEDKEARDGAYDELFGCIWHQGTVTRRPRPRFPS